MPARPTYSKTEQSQLPTRHSLGTWLLVAFVFLALLPAITGLPSWLGSRAIQAPLQEVATVIDSVGRQDRAFRAHVRSLYARLFVQRNFADRESYEQTAALVRDDLAGMREQVTALADSNLVPAAADYVATQDRIEGFTEAYLNLVDERLLQTEAFAQQSADMADSLGELSHLAGSFAAGEARAWAGAERLEASARDMASVAARLQSQQSPGDIESLRSEFAYLTAAADALVENGAGNVLPGAVAKALDDIERIALGDGGLFDTAATIAEQDEREFADRSALRTDVVAMIARFVELDAANDRAAVDLLLASSAALQKFSQSLIVGVVVGTLLAFGIVFVFVRGNVLRRLRNVTSSTRRLTGGQLESPVESEGDDELAELANALETFRRSALELRLSRSALKERTEQVEQANRELDQFAYIASHDLKAPMRAIASLVDFLREDLEGTPSPEVSRHLDMMQNRVVRLDALLDSLLEYSRAGRSRAPSETVDLRQLVEDCVGVVAPAGGTVEFFGDFGRVSTCPAPFEQVVRNLVDNAFKHNDAEHGHVAIECDVIDGSVRLSVSDNGPGIDPQYHERVFGMFQTLKPRDVVEGSGMGLAILKKLVDGYGGSIRLESDPATKRGTTITIYWPVDARLPNGKRQSFDPALLAAVAAN